MTTNYGTNAPNDPNHLGNAPSTAVGQRGIAWSWWLAGVLVIIAVAWWVGWGIGGTGGFLFHNQSSASTTVTNTAAPAGPAAPATTDNGVVNRGSAASNGTMTGTANASGSANPAAGTNAAATAGGPSGAQGNTGSAGTQGEGGAGSTQRNEPAANH